MGEKFQSGLAKCVNNKDYPASLEIGKTYQVIPDSRADKQELIRVIDESGEDYFYPQDYFDPVEDSL